MPAQASFASLVSTVLALLGSTAFAQTGRVFDELQTVHPYSVANVLTTTPDGRFLYSGEGGAIAFIDTRHESEFANPGKRLPIGSQGVVPVEMHLDPEAGYQDGILDGPKDLLYLAAGRSGLWVMEADPAPGVQNRAARVDDSRDGDVAKQDSRRWCSDVGFFRLGGVPYLAALFAKQDASRLRIYALNDVRRVLLDHPGEETGNELVPRLEVRLGRLVHPHAVGGALFGYALAVDQVGPASAVVYLALGAHGLARVPLSLANVTGGAPAAVEYGPVFGDGSHYHQNAPNGEWYSSIQYKNIFGNSGEIQAEHPPLFVDVAVQNGGLRGDHFLYAAVDHAGWVRFDISASTPWNESTAVDHHEGVEIGTPWGDVQVSVADDENPMIPPPYTYVHHVQVVQLARGPVLAVAASNRPLLRSLARNEGYALDHVGERLGGVEISVLEQIQAHNAHILLYDLDGSALAPGTNFVSSLQRGASSTSLAPTPEEAARLRRKTLHLRLLPEEGEGGRVVFFGTVFRALADLDAGSVQVTHERGREDIRGWATLAIGYSKSNPDVLLMGANDGGFAGDGVLVTCPEIKVHGYEPNVNGSDNRAAQGILFDNDAQWPVGKNNDEYIWSKLGAGWRIKRFHPGSNLCSGTSDPPRVTGDWAVAPPVDRFGSQGRWFHQGTLDLEYDIENDKGWRVVFASRTGAADGVAVLHRGRLVKAIEDRDTSTSPLLLEGPGAIDGALVANLNTHPEFDNVDLTHPDADDFIRENGLAGAVNDLAPKLFELPADGRGTPDRWVLAVPCGTVYNPPDLPIYQQHPAWRASGELAANFNRLFVQFWDVQDPDDLVPDPVTGSVPSTLPKLFGPERGAAFALETLELGGAVYLFVSDFGGRVLVYDVTRLLVGERPLSVASWSSPHCMTDTLPNNVWELAVDVDRGEVYVYAAIPRVGLQILRFDPAEPAGKRLAEVELMQTPGNVASVVIRTQENGQKTLLVSDVQGGVRIFEYGP